MSEDDELQPIPVWASPGSGPVRIGVRRLLMRVGVVISACMLIGGVLALASSGLSAGGVFATVIGLGGLAATVSAIRSGLPALQLDASGFQMIGLNNPTSYGTGVGEYIPWEDVAEFVLDSNVTSQNTQKLAMVRYKVDRFQPTASGVSGGLLQQPGHYFPPMLALGPRDLLAVLRAWHAASSENRNSPASKNSR